MKKGILSSIGLAFLLLSCSPKKPAPAAASTEPTGGALMTKEIALAQFNAAQFAEGEALFRAKCGNCHKLHQPSAFGEERWNKVLNRMLPKAKATEEEGKLIRAYLIANSGQ